MSISSEINRIKTSVINSYTALEEVSGKTYSNKTISTLADEIRDVTVIKQQEAINLAYRSIWPLNRFIYNDYGEGSAFVWIPKFHLCDVLSTTDTSIHPAFIVDGNEISHLFIGKFPANTENDRLYSLPVKLAASNLSASTINTRSRNNGQTYHEITAAEWGAIALLSHRLGYKPKGNNNFGKDISEPFCTGMVANWTDSSHSKVRLLGTGTGPVSWRHDGTSGGISDLNGNLNEYCTGIRLNYSTLLVIPYNNAANPLCDLSGSSTAWKAINADATGWSDIFVDATDTTANIVKLRTESSSWIYSTSGSDNIPPFESKFSSISCDETISDFAKLYLMSLGILPDDTMSESGLDYGEESILIGTNSSYYYMCRGGDYSDGAKAGLFRFTMKYNYSSGTSSYNGGRIVWYAL